MLSLFLFIGGIILAGFGLLQATHGPYQKWWYSCEKKGSINVDSEEYKTAIFHMSVAGSGALLIGGLMLLYSLSELGWIH